jgi:putative nucleotidyltransferase with HDIG domain
MDNHLRILVVDDEENIRNVFKRYLESKTNYTVLTAPDGLEAIEKIKNEGIDCCFTDLSMPNLDGVELVRKINLHDNTIPVVVFTGYPSMDNVLDSLKNGVVDFITKPVEMAQIDLIIKRVMQKRSLFVNNILLKEKTEKNEKLIKINEELKHKIKDLEAMNLILHELDRATTSKDLFNILVDLTGEITPCDEAHFCIIIPETNDHAIITSFFRDKSRTHVNISKTYADLIKRVADDGIPSLVKGTNGDGNIMAIPLKIRSKLFGILISIIRNGSSCFNAKDLYFLNFLSEKASFLIENLALYENIYENLFSTLYAFVEAIEAKDPYTKQHSTRVSNYAMLIAEAMGCSQEEIDELNVAGNLHDIGKIGIPDKILLKPGRLSEDEYEIIKKHPVIGSNIIGHLNMWTDEQRIIRHHHERFDGKGYPDCLQGEEIPFLSRIMSVADVYDALTSNRSYREKMSYNVAVKMILENAGKQFDPDIVEVFSDLYKQGQIIP